LHPALIEEGFLQYLVGLPKTAASHRAIHGVISLRSECRDAWLPDEVKNALLGHDDGSAAQDYGEFYIRTVLYEAITKINSPFDKERSDDAAANVDAR
jgi:hypothetical protein